MFDYKGNPFRKAGPATPIQIMGLNEVPHAGKLFQVVKNRRQLVIVEERLNNAKEKRFNAKKATLEELFEPCASW